VIYAGALSGIAYLLVRIITLLVRFLSGPIDYFYLVLENGSHDTAIYSQCGPVRR
jgi:hypothetical protein